VAIIWYNGNMVNLSQKRCVPCEGGTPPLENDKIHEYLEEVEGWELEQGGSAGLTRIKKTFKFKTFLESIDFVNRVAGLAEQENHHPDIIIRYRKVTFELVTHAIKGLSENDFIMASKINLVYKWEEKVEKVVVSKIFTVKVLATVVIVLLVILLGKYLFS